MKNETENKSNLEIFDMYLADELVLDERVFQVPGVRLEKCIYLLEKELTTLQQHQCNENIYSNYRNNVPKEAG